MDVVSEEVYVPPQVEETPAPEKPKKKKDKSTAMVVGVVLAVVAAIFFLTQ